ncbi:MAG: hypothetical protein QXX51_00210 [Candidatus Bathyarchaeia archaeon]
MKTNYKKIIKLATLLATSLLIATTSAQVYTQMFLTAHVGVAGLSLKWVQGSNENVTANIAGSTCTLNGLQGYPGQTALFNDTVRITNAGSSTVTFNITTTQCTGDTSKLTSIYVRIYDSTSGNLLHSLTVWSGGGTGSPLTNLQIDAGATWKLSWEITWSNDATVSNYVDVTLRLDVNS